MSTYALPDGSLVELPEHCRDMRERFQLADRTVVWAVCVSGAVTPEVATWLAQTMTPPKSALQSSHGASA